MEIFFFFLFNLKIGGMGGELGGGGGGREKWTKT